MDFCTSNIARNILVPFIAAIYFFVATSHIFLLKNTTHADLKSQIHNKVNFKRTFNVFYSKVDNTSLIKLIDKTTVENKKTVTDFIKLIAECFVTILFVLAVWLLEPRLLNIRSSGYLIDYQNHYLSLCALRI